MNKFFVATFALLAVSQSFGAGEIIDPKFKPVPEVTEERLKKDQMHQATMGEVQNNKPAASTPVASQMGSDRGQANVAAASSARVLVTATEEQKKGATESRPWFSIALTVASFGLLVFGAKNWADKNIPNPSPKRGAKAKLKSK